MKVNGAPRGDDESLVCRLDEFQFGVDCGRLARGDADAARPGRITIKPHTDRARPDRRGVDDKRSGAGELVVQKHCGTGRLRPDDETASMNSRARWRL